MPNRGYGPFPPSRHPPRPGRSSSSRTRAAPPTPTGTLRRGWPAPPGRRACATRGGRNEDPLFTDLYVLADQVAEALAPVRGDGPLLLLGHSLGTAVAYEVVRRMPDQRRLALVASGHPAPSRIRLPVLDDPVGDGWGDPDGPLVELIASLGGADAGLLEHPALRQIFLPVIRGDLMAHSRYRPAVGSAVDCCRGAGLSLPPARVRGFPADPADSRTTRGP
ncbi:thioesterase II family protein [Streptomyces sp. NY05-11A]